MTACRVGHYEYTDMFFFPRKKSGTSNATSLGATGLSQEQLKRMEDRLRTRTGETDSEDDGEVELEEDEEAGGGGNVIAGLDAQVNGDGDAA